MPLSIAPVAPISAHQLLVLLLQLAMLLGLALVLGRLAVRLGVPAIVGELCAGVLAGPSILAHLAPGVSGFLLPHSAEQFHLLDAVGQVGVLLLVGMTGMQMDLGLIGRRSGTAAAISAAGIVVPLGLGVLVGLLLPASLVPGGTHRSTFALFLGVAMGVSAIPVIAKTLMDLRLLHRNVGQLTLCAVMLDDIVGWMLLAVVSAMATTGVRAGTVLLSVGYLVLVILAAAVLRPLVRFTLRRVVSTDERVASALVVVMMLGAAAATEAMGLEAVFGAFAAGVMLASVRPLPAVTGLRTVVLSVLAPLFFATAGLRIDVTLLARPIVLLTGVCVLLAAIVGKFVGAYVGARLTRLGHWEAVAIGAGMNARGVIEVIIAMVGLRLGVLSPQMYTIVVLVAVVTSLMAPPILRVAMDRVEQTAEERLRSELLEPTRVGEHTG